MKQSSILFVGLDVHLASLDRALRRLISQGHKLHVVYEAAPAAMSFIGT